MAILSSNRIAWLYTDDFGAVYRVAAVKDLTSQAVLGGSAATGFEPERPTDFKMRRITVSTADGKSRVLPVYTPGAPILTSGTLINVNYDQVETAFKSSRSFIPEQHRRPNVTHQTA